MATNQIETEQPFHYRHLEKMSVNELLTSINTEDKSVAIAVEKALPQIESLVNAAVEKMEAGGRLFYIGAGTSGRLAVVDASECPPTFGVAIDLVTAIIAGGEKAITKAVEFAEDDEEQGWKDLQQNKVSVHDFVIGISASGTTPYVDKALQECINHSIVTGCIVCNCDTIIAATVHFPIEVITGPEIICGSTRMKAGTTQKMVLNMISTAVMIKLGRVEDNKMINMQLTNNKLIARGVNMIMESLGISDYEAAKKLLMLHGNVKKTLEIFSGK